MYDIREMKEREYPLLEDFLYEAIFIPEGVAPPPRDVIKLPELQVYTAGFGSSKDDLALVCETEGNVAGAVWARIMDDYGHVDDETPSLSISLYREYRNRGFGREMMKRMLALLKERGYKKASLSVQKENYACELYRDLGFETFRETQEEYIMIKYL